MDLYVVANIVLILAILLALGVVTWGLRRWLKWREGEIQARAFAGAEQLGFPDRMWIEQIQAASRRYGERSKTLAWVVLMLNVATTIVALIPLGLGVYNLFANNPHQALNFGLLSLATLFVTKGGLFVLPLFIKGAIGGAGGYVGQQAAKKAWKRWNAQKEQPPTK